MHNKLTLKLDKEAIGSAKQYARKHKTSVSALVENYFRSLTAGKKKKYKAEELAGCLKDMGQLTDDDIRNMYAKDRHHA